MTTTSFKKSFRFLFFFTLLISISTLAQESKFKFGQYDNTKGDTLLYRILSPKLKSDTKYPLVIFLHGSGERGKDNTAQLKWGALNFTDKKIMKNYPAFVIAPQCPPNFMWHNGMKTNKNGDWRIEIGPTPSKPMELTLVLIHQLITTLPIDTNRIYITGLSLGGMGSFDAMMRFPHLFAAAVPICGAGDTSKAASIAHIPMWIFHGADDNSVNPQFSFDMVTALHNAGAHPGLTVYPSVKHTSWIAAYKDLGMYDWLFKQKK